MLSLNLGVTSHLCHLLLVRSQILPTIKGKILYKGVDARVLGITGSFHYN
jgi:hypothetical protein